MSVAEQADGAIRFLCSSLYDETFTGNFGEIATLKIKIPEDCYGSYPIYLRNIKLTETDINKFYETDVIESFVTIISDGILDVKVSQDNKDAFNISGQKVSKDFKGIIIKDGRKFFNK